MHGGRTASRSSSGTAASRSSIRTAVSERRHPDERARDGAHVAEVLSQHSRRQRARARTRPAWRKRCRRQRAELRYRDLVVVAVMTSDPEPFPDNWIYVHDPGTRAGRVQNFGAWSPDMVRPGTTCLGVRASSSRATTSGGCRTTRRSSSADELAAIGLIDAKGVWTTSRSPSPRRTRCTTASTGRRWRCCAATSPASRTSGTFAATASTGTTTRILDVDGDPRHDEPPRRRAGHGVWSVKLVEEYLEEATPSTRCSPHVPSVRCAPGSTARGTAGRSGFGRPRLSSVR